MASFTITDTRHAVVLAPPPAPAVPEFEPRRFAADFAASWQTYSTTLILSYPIDTMRVRFQTLGQRPLDVLRSDGLRALYAGFLTPVAANGPIFGLVFATNEFYRPVVMRAFRCFEEPPRKHETTRFISHAVSDVEKSNNNTFAAHHSSTASTTMTSSSSSKKGCDVAKYRTGELAAAGFMTGVTCSVLQCPANTIRVHQQISAQGGTCGLSARESAALLRAECGGSWRGVFRALPAEAVANGVGRMFYFTIYETLKRQSRVILGNDRADTMPVKLALGASTAVLGWVVNFPVDVVKTKIQGDAIAIDLRNPILRTMSVSSRSYVVRGVRAAAAAGRQGPRMYDGFGHCAAELYRDFGLRGFYRGFGLTALRSSVSAGFSLPLFELVKPSYHAAFGVTDDK